MELTGAQYERIVPHVPQPQPNLKLERRQLPNSCRTSQRRLA